MVDGHIRPGEGRGVLSRVVPLGDGNLLLFYERQTVGHAAYTERITAAGLFAPPAGAIRILDGCWSGATIASGRKAWTVLSEARQVDSVIFGKGGSATLVKRNQNPYRIKASPFGQSPSSPRGLVADESGGFLWFLDFAHGGRDGDSPHADGSLHFVRADDSTGATKRFKAPDTFFGGTKAGNPNWDGALENCKGCHSIRGKIMAGYRPFRPNLMTVDDRDRLWFVFADHNRFGYVQP